MSRDSFGDNFSGGAPNRSQLNSFLGMPSDGGMHSLSSNTPKSYDGNNVQVNRGMQTGANGGTGYGTSITGPQGNTAFRGIGQSADGTVGVGRGVSGADGGGAAQGVARGADGGVAAFGGARNSFGDAGVRGVGVGPDGGVAAGGAARNSFGQSAAVGAVAGPDGGQARGAAVSGPYGYSAARGVAVGPDGGVAAGTAVRGPYGGVAARGVAVGPYGGAAAGFARVSPSGRYVCGTAVRGSYTHWGCYGAGWYTAHPDAWRAAAWGAATAWTAATWASAGSYAGCDSSAPVSYDYGSNVTYQNNNVYVNGYDAGTSQAYYQQAENLAATGAKADASPDGDWLPLGVFAFAKPDQTTSDVSIQLAVNKQGILRGNYTDNKTDKTQVIQGSVDKQTQRAAFTIGDDKTEVIEVGLYNLTKDEAPVLVHFGADRTEQMLLVRLKKPNGSGSGESGNASNG